MTWTDIAERKRAEEALREADRHKEFVVRIPLPPPESAPTPSPRGTGLRVASGRRILVVDDNTDAAESLADLLRLLGHEVEVAYDGPSALAKVRGRTPDTIFCDIGLPGMNGYDVAREVRAGQVDYVQLIALTGYAQAEDVKRAIEAGFDAHLAKPPDPADIERLIG